MFPRKYRQALQAEAAPQAESDDARNETSGEDERSLPARQAGEPPEVGAGLVPGQRDQAENRTFNQETSKESTVFVDTSATRVQKIPKTEQVPQPEAPYQKAKVEEQAPVATLSTEQTGPTFARYDALGDEIITLDQAIQDVKRIIGFDLPFDVVENKYLPEDVPARFSLSDRIIEFDPNIKATRAQAVQWLVEEVMHGVDTVGPDKTISASSRRLDLEHGDLGREIKAAYDKVPFLTEFLYYPIHNDDLSDTRKTAELFARLGALYFGDPQLLQSVVVK